MLRLSLDFPPPHILKEGHDPGGDHLHHSHRDDGEEYTPVENIDTNV